ncbi:MAG TPA: trehalose-6-phosphate synthase [Persephonella sp.]|uniref:Alpha,alpha-trehalose-phosphate synthase [UDP-forming] (Trehalose-6-phosphate synthase) (UDP-glucose-glucosephosphateglucosyltransferase) n=1 Tax=Persephonella marina (strain DSM 14350 / EX-H1) TaxID=123214 RepID=C0QT01_PERMH|nr:MULTISPECIES: trehalose-6-phosphate synthase [Persephonella]ACO04509.1 alpha,alpha-trehalose-phosphate synthase [UDP-forming] (Trehalose-6-phosphate synthase) (UDP-glucose-glucosephosphateglucosyltransferase) [Persephonella marina EX-H1]HCB70565.1 trehalose-6-phosphate synthase [Persephonella sp.]
MEKGSNLIVVSAVLPIHIKKEDGRYTVHISPGGLVTALKQVLHKRKALWIGWAGSEKITPKMKNLIFEEGKKEGFLLYPISLTEREIDHFFNGFSNGIIWPMFHTFQYFCRFEPEYWKAYQEVNRKFARYIKSISTEKDLVWVHDYHFFLLPQYIENLGLKRKTAFFLHIPFPNPELFFKIPWRVEILKGMLRYDLIGFHTFIDRKNFLDCIDELVEGVNILSTEPVTEILYEGKKIKIGVFPISVDFNYYSSLSEKSEKSRFPFKDLKVILGIDRLDYTKGLIQKIRSYKRFLEKYPEFHKKVVLVQAVAPNIKKLPEYDQLKVELEHLISETNGRFGTPDWTPIYYYPRRMPFEDLINYYRFSDICWVNSIKDGMNLVAKEYIACQIENKGALMLSEFTGAAAELRDHACLVNPYDIEGCADALYRVLTKDSSKKELKMQRMREHIKHYDISWWGNTMLETAFGKKIIDFPELEEDIPLHELSKSF